MALDAGAIPTALPAGVARVDFNLMKAIIDGSFPLQSVDLDALQVIAAKLGPQAVETAKVKLLNITAALLAADAVETDKIKNLNVTPGKASLGFGRYVPRAAAAVDFTQAVLDLDGTWKVDGLDLSAILPVGAIAAHVNISLNDNAADQPFTLRANATTKQKNTIKMITQVANILRYTDGILYVDSNRLVDYVGPAGLDSINIIILGWFI